MRKRYCIFFPNHGDCKMMNHASEFAAKQIETTERQMKLSDKIELSIKHHKAVVCVNMNNINTDTDTDTENSLFRHN